MSKKIIAMLLSACILLSGCSFNQAENKEIQSNVTEATAEIETSVEDEIIPEFNSLSDTALCLYLEETIFSNVVANLNSEEYFVEDVKAVYISKEYLEELAYNSQSNIYFGYTFSEIEEAFGNQKYVFTCNDAGETVIAEYELYDDTFDQIIKNVAIGSGAILVCVTVSLVSGGAGAPAVSAIFAMSAKTGTIMALESAGISGVITAAVTGYETKNVEETLKQTALSASDGFKFGAIMGSVTGGFGELITLGQATKGGLTLNEAAIIQKNTGLSSKFIKQISSMEEYEELVAIAEQGGLTINDMAAICSATNYPLKVVKLFKTTEEGTIYFEEAGLVEETINGKIALIRTIDLAYESELAGETVTNLERMRRGYAAIDPLTGEAYQLHHVGQSIDSPLAILTQAEHTGGGNNGILHDLNIADGQGVHSLMSDTEWATQRQDFWKGMYELLK